MALLVANLFTFASLELTSHRCLLCNFEVRMGKIPEAGRETCGYQRDDIR